MGSLNYGNVDFKEFESLAKDVMNKLLGKQLERFGEGKDGGIDLVDDTVNPTIIVQCKMYSTSTSAVNTLLGEKDKVEKFPSLQEYYIFTSTSLLPQQVLKLRNHFSKWMSSDANIIYNEKIEDFFNKKENMDVLERHLEFFDSFPGWYKRHIINKTTGSEITKTPAQIKLYGRTQELDNLEQMILENQRYIMIDGLGGIGKSALARQLYRRLKDKFSCIGWINYRGSLKESLNSDITVSEFEGMMDPEERIKAIYQFLREQQKALLFIDDVPNDICEEELFNDLTGCDNLTLVLTSRSEYIEPFITYKIDYLDKEDCIELFYLHYQRQKNRQRTEKETAIIQKLVCWAFCHTLTIELLAKAAVRERSLSDYLKRLQENGFKAPKLKINNHTVLEHIKMLYRMADFEKGSEKYHILWNLAIMPTMNIPAEVEDWISADINDLEELIQAGWLDALDGSYYMHSLIQEIVLQESEGGIAPNGIADHFFSFVIEKEFTTKAQVYTEKQPRFDILDSVLKHVRYDDYAVIDSVLMKYGDTAWELALADKARVAYEEAKKIREKKLGAEHPSTGTIYNNLAVLYQAMGNYELSIKYFERALGIFENSLGAEHPYTKQTKEALSFVKNSLNIT